MTSTPGAPPIVPRSGPPGGMQTLPGPPPIVSRPGMPPAPPAPQPTQQPVPQTQLGPTPQESRDIEEVQQVYSEIQLLGRDRGLSDEMQAVMDGMRRVASSNVYGYFFELERGSSGLLYVTFLGVNPNHSRSSSPGATYVYFDVPTAKFNEFQQASEASAGKAVWDYLRVRGTVWQHQHRYRLVQSSGNYIPRKATKLGFKTRQVAPTGQPKIPNSTWSAISRLERSPSSDIRVYAGKIKQALLGERGFRRSTLAPRSFLPNRGTPNRGRPNRGTT